MYKPKWHSLFELPLDTDNINSANFVAENNELKFINLWSPSRFEHLAVYLILVVLPVLLFSCYESVGCMRIGRLRHANK